jgi:hypothetical protein
MEEREIFHKQCWSDWTSTGQKIKKSLSLNLIPHVEIKSKWIMGLNITRKTMNLKGENFRKTS